MKISAKGEYAYRAVFDLALESRKTPDAIVQLESIAERQKIPKKYLVQILLQLKRAGLVGTLRGIRGGYYLRKTPSQISLGEVLELIEGPFVPISRSMNQPNGGIDELSQVLSPIFEDVRSAIRDILYQVSFEDICRRAHQPKEQMYYI